MKAGFGLLHRRSTKKLMIVVSFCFVVLLHICVIICIHAITCYLRLGVVKGVG